MEAVVHITGHAGTEVETKANGTVAKFRLASTPRVRTKGEWGDGNTTWIEVSCFRALAEHVASSIRKGDPVVVIGRLRTNVWEKDGQTHDRLVIEAETIGHDLNRGTAAFRRKVRAVAPEAGEVEAPPDEHEDAGLSAEERAARAA
jgi:single-strand DNA-binding protein